MHLRRIGQAVALANTVATLLGCNTLSSSELDVGRTSSPLVAAISASSALSCNATTQVDVSVTAGNITTITPTDIIFVVDGSGSISTAQFSQVRTALTGVVNTLGPLFQNGGKIGLVRFDAVAIPALQLSADAGAITGAISSLANPTGGTCTVCGINSAVTMFQNGSASERKKVAVVLTDGMSTVLPNGQQGSPQLRLEALQAATAAASSAGIETFAVAIGSNVSSTELKLIATDPDAEHLIETNFDQLGQALTDVAAAVITPEATGASLTLTVNAAFTPSSPTANHGTVAPPTGNVIEWTLGTLQDQTAVLRYQLKHSNATGGELTLHSSYSYEDIQGNALTLPAKVITITGCDGDDDGVLDETDKCKDTASDDPVDASGCSIAQLCPCEGFGNHGQYVSCVTRTAQTFRRAGIINEAERAAIVRSAAMSDCSK